jgi:hypothetical protein
VWVFTMYRTEITALTRRLRLAFAVTLVGTLVACGAEQTAGIQGSGSPVAAGVTSQGPINRFGSIFVDGVEYSTSSAQIRVDGEAATESQLRVGHVVTIRGTVNDDGRTGTATEVNFAQHLRGPIGPIDVSSGTFIVLGQIVRVSDSTLFDDSIVPADISGLRFGDSVQVSGFISASGKVIASRVEPALATDSFQVKGAVKSLDSAGRTFRINALTVDFSAATVSGTLADSSTVVVKGTSISTFGALIATRVDVSSGLTAAANDQGQLEGFISAFTSSSDFVVEGQRVATTATTELVLRGGALGLDVPVKIRGTFNASGVLVASRIEVKPRSLSRIHGLVDSVSAASNTLTVLGVAVTTDAATSFNDRSPQPLRSFSSSDVRTGDYVHVRGTPAASGAGLVATVVERTRAEDDSFLRGVAMNVAAPNFTVLGVNVTTNAQTRFIGVGGGTEASAMFFERAANETVNVRGTLVGNVLQAERVQLEPSAQ